MKILSKKYPIPFIKEMLDELHSTAGLGKSQDAGG